MRIHHFLFTLLLVLLSQLAAFTESRSNPITCLRRGGFCWGLCPGGTRQIGDCGISWFRCCKKL
ncbi:beta-defensin 4-like [Nannospalax galili]|uniref:Beta-defensin 4-like n=1 Tax=Nannospalax galili TaxID=1026970 RepID=A0A8C6QAE8_NANGA|nr:beta-defensin 4-like [Nannospalax galili]